MNKINIEQNYDNKSLIKLDPQRLYIQDKVKLLYTKVTICNGLRKRMKNVLKNKQIPFKLILKSVSWESIQLKFGSTNTLLRYFLPRVKSSFIKVLRGLIEIKTLHHSALVQRKMFKSNNYLTLLTE